MYLKFSYYIYAGNSIADTELRKDILFGKGNTDINSPPNFFLLSGVVIGILLFVVIILCGIIIVQCGKNHFKRFKKPR